MTTFTKFDVDNILECAKVQADMLKERIKELETAIQYVINENRTCPFTGKQVLRDALK